MFDTAQEYIDYCRDNDKQIYDIVLETEEKNTGKKEEYVREELGKMLKVMEESAQGFLNSPSVTYQKMIDGSAYKMNEYANNEEPIVGKFIAQTMAMAFSTLEVSAAMGKIVASPTAGSSGILPAALVQFKNKYDISDEELVNGMLTAIGVGELLGKYATFAGADGGCQAETGSAAAMAAGAMVYLRGGSVEQVFNAGCFAILHVLGLVCDPVAGLVEYPCVFRNGMGVVNAMISADMALAGIKSIVPFEEVCQAMRKVGKTLPPSLRETGMGGVAGTNTGQRIRRRFLGIDESSVEDDEAV
ncbi:MAG: L-serine ammonia-lyase, iron-sulfur-dependent, subunit alpha [Finegoldia sp.]|nr:L-serine ammonia-lyase, iron-sulfur-dependent, subunit alpha [Finegoldia sp.]